MHIEGDDRDRISEAGTIIAGWTRLWSRLLVLHVAGPDGRCRGCPSAGHAAPRWPCRLAGLARAAQAAHGGANRAPAISSTADEPTDTPERRRCRKALPRPASEP